MIRDISYKRYDMLTNRYYNELQSLERSSVSIGVGSRLGTRLFTYLYIALNNEDSIEFSHDLMTSRHP